VAFGSAAVPRPVGSSLMPLRRTPHRPDLARWLVRFNLDSNAWCANRICCCGGRLCVAARSRGSPQGGGHEQRHAVGPRSPPTNSPQSQ